jgi:3-dehydroquinate dehydratase type I
MTYLTVPIAAANFEQAKRQIKAASRAGAEMLELRSDYLENLNPSLVEKLIAEIKGTKRPLPIIVTCRDYQQGGARQYPHRLRVTVLTAALKAGAEFIDFEYENFFEAQSQEKIRRALAESSKGRLILSAHNFESRFDDIGKLYRTLRRFQKSFTRPIISTTALMPSICCAGPAENASFSAWVRRE